MSDLRKKAIILVIARNQVQAAKQVPEVAAPPKAASVRVLLQVGFSPRLAFLRVHGLIEVAELSDYFEETPKNSGRILLMTTHSKNVNAARRLECLDKQKIASSLVWTWNSPRGGDGGFDEARCRLPKFKCGPVVIDRLSPKLARTENGVRQKASFGRQES
jgi:hypothetical protein